MRVIARKSLREFWARHPSIEQPLRAWFAEVSKAQWSSPADIKEHYASASMVGSDRVVFNIKGDQCRLVVAVRYDLGIVFIRFIGTHAEYDTINVRSI